MCTADRWDVVVDVGAQIASDATVKAVQLAGPDGRCARRIVGARSYDTAPTGSVQLADLAPKPGGNASFARIVFDPNGFGAGSGWVPLSWPVPAVLYVYSRTAWGGGHIVLTLE